MSLSDIHTTLPTPVGYVPYEGRSGSFAKADHSHAIGVEDWKYLEYENDWVNYEDESGTVEQGKYLLLPDGFVICYGTIKDGTVTDGTTLFTLPVGYRPAKQIVTVGATQTAFARIDVEPDGDVVGRFGLLAANTSFFLFFEADRDTYVQTRS